MMWTIIAIYLLTIVTYSATQTQTSIVITNDQSETDQSTSDNIKYFQII